MQALIVEKTIATSVLKTGFFVAYKNLKHRIENVNGTKITIAPVTITDRPVYGEPIVVDFSEICNNVIRYTATLDVNKTFDLCYTDYARAIDGVKEEGYTRKEFRTVKTDDEVRLTNIRIIDQYDLLAFATRRAIIIDSEKSRGDWTYHLKLQDGRIIKALREDFEPVGNGSNTRSLFHIKCVHCE